MINDLKRGVVCAGVGEMMALGEAFAGKLLGADQVVVLEGQVGAGKTTFVKGMARGLGIERVVTSPTFSIYSIYKGCYTLVHLDAYRLDKALDANDLCLDDVLVSPYCFVVEWPENFPAIRHYTPAWWLKFAIEDDGAGARRSVRLVGG